MIKPEITWNILFLFTNYRLICYFFSRSIKSFFLLTVINSCRYQLKSEKISTTYIQVNDGEIEFLRFLVEKAIFFYCPFMTEAIIFKLL